MQFTTTITIHLDTINPLNAELNSTCHLLALSGAHHILHISRIRVKTQTYIKSIYSVFLNTTEYKHLKAECNYVG